MNEHHAQRMHSFSWFGVSSGVVPGYFGCWHQLLSTSGLGCPSTSIMPCLGAGSCMQMGLWRRTCGLEARHTDFNSNRPLHGLLCCRLRGSTHVGLPVVVHGRSMIAKQLLPWWRSGLCVNVFSMLVRSMQAHAKEMKADVPSQLLWKRWYDGMLVLLPIGCRIDVGQHVQEDGKAVLHQYSAKLGWQLEAAYARTS